MLELLRWCGVAGLLAVVAGGCMPALRGLPEGPSVGGLAPPIPLATPNPALIQTRDRDFLWDQVVDVVDDYFPIDREERVRLVGDILTEGRIDTQYELGATVLEPWRGNSVGRHNRWEATLQTIRKRAVVRVIPAEEGYLVDVTVLKEREALSRPIHPSAGEATFRNNNDLANQNDELLELLPPPTEWTPIGRDIALEQKMLLQLQSAVGGQLSAISR